MRWIWKLKKKLRVKNRAMKCQKVRVRVRVKEILRVDGYEDVTMGDKKPKAYIFNKNAGSQFNRLPDAEPMDYFILFINNELLNNTVIEANRYSRYKTAEL
jgi:hypothetical protein